MKIGKYVKVDASQLPPLSPGRVPQPQISSPNYGQRPISHEVRRAFEENLSPEVLAEVKEKLKRDWYSRERDQYILELQQIWAPPDTLRLLTQMSKLHTISEKEAKNTLGEISWANPEFYAKPFYNKATVFYWMDSATVVPSDCDGLAIVGSIWNTWIKTLGRQPRFQLEDFFAVPVSVPRNIAKTIPEILQAHENICSQVRGKLEKEGADTIGLHPICEALLVIFDEYKFVDSAYLKEEDGRRHYANVAQHQSILLVRTGKEERLSTAISFDSLKHEAVPLSRKEELGNFDLIQVPLQVGIRFLANLVLREEAASPALFRGLPHISEEECEMKAFLRGEADLAWRQERGDFWKGMTISEVKEVMMLGDKYESDVDPSFKLTWV